MVQESKMNLFPPALGEIRWVLGLGTHWGKPMVVFDLRPMKNKGFFLIKNNHCSIGNSTQIYKIIFVLSGIAVWEHYQG